MSHACETNESVRRDARFVAHSLVNLFVKSASPLASPYNAHSIYSCSTLGIFCVFGSGNDLHSGKRSVPTKMCDTTSVLVRGIFSRGGWMFVRCGPGIHRKACALVQVLRGFSTSWMSTATKLFAWRLSISACQYGGRYTRGEVKHCCSDHR